MVPWLALVLSGCVNQRAGEQLGERLQEANLLREQTRQALENGRQTAISWRQASTLMLERNLDVRSAESALQNHVRTRRTLLLSEIGPSISTFAGLGSGLDSLADISSDNLNARVIGGMRIPNPFFVYARSYGLAVQHYQLVQTRELAHRRVMSSLYAQFLQQESIDLQRQRLGVEEKELSRLPASDQMKRILELDRRKRTLELQDQQQRLAMNRLLNTPGAYYRALPATLPDISYAKRLHTLTAASGFGQLAMRMAAAEMEGTILMIWQVKLQRLPSFSMNISSPTLWDVQNNSAFAVEDLDLFGSVSRGYQFTGAEAQRLRSAEERAQNSRETLAQRFEMEQSTILRAINLYQQSLLQEQLAEKRLGRLQENPPRLGAEAVLRHWRDVQQTRQLMESARAQRRNLDLQLWVWDEQAWKR